MAVTQKAIVIPAKAGIRFFKGNRLDTGFRRYDGFSTATKNAPGQDRNWISVSAGMKEVTNEDR